MNHEIKKSESLEIILQNQKRMDDLEYKNRLLEVENRRLTHENELLHMVRDELMNLLKEEMTKLEKMSQTVLHRG